MLRAPPVSRAPSKLMKRKLEPAPPCGTTPGHSLLPSGPPRLPALPSGFPWLWAGPSSSVSSSLLLTRSGNRKLPFLTHCCVGLTKCLTDMPSVNRRGPGPVNQARQLTRASHPRVWS